MTTAVLLIGSDNAVILDKLKDSSTDAYINSGVTCTFTLYKEVAIDGAMTLGDATLTSASAPFVAGDVGKAITVRGAGAQGSDLRTTISSFTSASEVELTATASTTVSNAPIRVSLPSAKDISMGYVTSSNGRYRGILDDAVTLADSELYHLEVTVDAGAGKKDFRRLAIGAQYRTYT